MKKLKILLLLTLTLSACHPKKGNVIINGAVQNDDKSEVLYSAILNDTYNGWFKDTIIPDSTGNFTLSFDIEQPKFILLLNNSIHKKIIIEPDKTYNVEINKEQGQIKIINNSEAQLFYDNLSSSHPNSCGFFPMDISNYGDIYNSLIEKLNSELTELKDIDCSKDVENLIKYDRKAYYNFAISSLSCRINVMSIRKKEDTPTEVMEMWEAAVCDTFLTNPLTKASSSYFDLLGLSFWYNFYTKLYCDSIQQIRIEKRKQGLIHSYNIELAKQLLPNEILEYYSASYIQSTAEQNKFEKELIALFETFKSEYPNSNYISYLEPKINTVIDFYDKAEKDFSNQIHIIGQDINSLNQLIKPFNGQRIYIDIWATSCGYCKDEFDYSSEFRAYMQDKDIVMLYISTDRDSREQLWQDMIKYYHLDGHHIRANKSLNADLKQLLGNYGLPRYLLLDENGKMINENMPRPSELEELKNIID